MAHLNSGKVTRTATKLSDVDELFKWHLLQIPELANCPPRVGHALVPLTDSKILMIGGGNHNGALNEIISIDLEPDQKNENEPVVQHFPGSEFFPARYEFLCAKDSKDRIWLFGGADPENAANEVINIEGDTIKVFKYSGEDSTDVLPCPRTQGSNSALLEFQGKECLAVFAGGLKGEQPVQDRDIYLFGTSECKWQKVNVKKPDSTTQLTTSCPFYYQPPLVQGHAMTAIGSKIFVHGGINNTTLYDGFHWLDLKKQNEDLTFSWVDSSVTDEACSERPSGRAAHAIARVMDVQKDSPLFYIFGGIGDKGPCNDLWSFNADAMCWTQITKNQRDESSSFHPVPRLDLAMCVVGLKDKKTSAKNSSIYLMIHGGMNRDGEIFNDAWIMKVQ